MRAQFTLIFVILLAFCFTPSCQKALSDQHVQYLGQWGSDKYALEIWKNGRGIYQKKQQAPIECWVKIDNNKIKFKSGSTTLKSFDIDADPYVNQQGFTVMMLDNQVFYKH